MPTYGNPAQMTTLNGGPDGAVVLQNGVLTTLGGDATNSGNPVTCTGLSLVGILDEAGLVHCVRVAITANKADLTAVTLASNDGITLVLGDRVLLANQTTTAENGIYVVSAVSGSTGTLTRAVDMAATAVLPAGARCQVSEGTLFGNTQWKITTAGAITVGTTSHAWYPARVMKQVTLVAGATSADTTIPILSTTKSLFLITRVTPNTTSSTVNYNAISVSAGVAGSASYIINAQVAAGTLNNADLSTLNIAVQNW